MTFSVDKLYSSLSSITISKSSAPSDEKWIAKYITIARKFVEANEKTFDFTSGQSRELVKLLVQHLRLIIPEKEETGNLTVSSPQLIYNVFQILRILSRDPKVVPFIDTDDYGHLLRFTSFSSYGKTLQCWSDDWIEISQDIDGEALKFFCNLSYHSSTVRKYLTSQKYAKTLLGIAQERVKNGLFLESDIFVMRILFLLSALEVQERLVIRRDYQGVSVLCESLATTVDMANRNPHRATGETENVKTVLPPFETKLSCEILKALFNVTVGISDSKVLDVGVVDQCTQLMEQLFLLFTQYSLDFIGSDNVFTHAANLLLNMPKDSFESFVPEIKEKSTEEAKEMSAETSLGSNGAETVEFQGHNLSAVSCLLEGLKSRLKSDFSMAKPELLPSLLSCLSYMCRLCQHIRKFIRFQVLPPLKDASKRPEESNDLRGKLVQLMTDIDRNVKYLSADFLFVLCKENVDRLVKHTGYGNAAGFLASRGLMLGRNVEFTGDYSSSEDDSDTEEYRGIEDQIDPITGAIRKDSGNPLQGMTEEEKELEAEKLVNLIGQLSDMKLIQPMKVGEDGRPVELGENEIKDIMRKKLEDTKP